MANHNHIFTNTQYDLGIGDHTGRSLQDIDANFKKANIPYTHSCYICSNKATHKLIAKHNALNSIELDKRGYVCTDCLQKKLVDPNQYGIKELK